MTTTTTTTIRSLLRRLDSFTLHTFNPAIFVIRGR